MFCDVSFDGAGHPGISNDSFGLPKYQYAVKVGDLQRVRIPPGQSVARLEAIKSVRNRKNLIYPYGIVGRSVIPPIYGF